MYACVAQLVRAVDRQSDDPGSNPGPVESVSFQGRILNYYENILSKFQVISMSFFQNYGF